MDFKRRVRNLQTLLFGVEKRLEPALRFGSFVSKVHEFWACLFDFRFAAGVFMLSAIEFSCFSRDKGTAKFCVLSSYCFICFVSNCLTSS